MTKPKKLLAILLSFILSSTACSIMLPPQASLKVLPLFTEAASTIVAEMTATQSASILNLRPTTQSTVTVTQLPMPTLASMPSALPSLRPAPIPCDLAQFVQDVSYPDGSRVDVSETFVKIWRVRNVGSCEWYANYTINYYSGLQMANKPEYRFPQVVIHPGETIDLQVPMQAPDEDGQFVTYWGLKNPDEQWIPFVDSNNVGGMSAAVAVGTGIAANTKLPFTVLRVKFNETRVGACADVGGKYVVTAKISSSDAGKVTFYWKRSDDVRSELISTTFLSAGMEEFTYEWITSENDVWVDVYIDSPNHQTFGRAKLYCQ